MNQTINISLPKALNNLAKKQVKDGYYSSVSEVIRDALRKLLSTTTKSIKLSTKADKRYDKMIADIESGKESVSTFKTTKELMDHLEKVE